MTQTSGFFVILKRVLSALLGLFLIGEKPVTPAADARLSSFYFSNAICAIPVIRGIDAHLTQDGWVADILMGQGEDICGLPLTESDVARLEEMISVYRLTRWAGFHEVDDQVLDGEMFSFSAGFSDGTVINAHGANAFPADYQEARTAILSEIEAILRAHDLFPIDE